MKTRLFAILVVAFTLCVVNMEGAVIPPKSNFTDELPIGSRQRMIDWAVTNRLCTFSITLYYTNNSNELFWSQRSSPTDKMKFASYEAYIDCVVSNGMAVYESAKSSMKPGTLLWINPVLFYSSLHASAIQSSTNVGLASLVTSNTFRYIGVDYVYAAVTVTNLQSFEIVSSLANGNKYHYVWTAQTGGSVYSPQPSPFPTELVNAGLISFYEWYSTNGSRTRFTMGGYDRTNCFTQYGELISSKPVALSGDGVRAGTSRGSDVCIQSSTNLSNWITVTNVLSVSSNHIFVPYKTDPRNKMLFFRSIAW